MSHKNVEALEHLYEQWKAGNFSDASLFDPYAVALLPDPTPRPHYGLESIAEYMRRFLDGWEDIRMEAESYREVNNTVLVKTRRTARGRGSGAAVDDRVIHAWTFRGSKVIRLEVFDQESDALEAVGLSD